MNQQQSNQPGETSNETPGETRTRRYAKASAAPENVETGHRPSRRKLLLAASFDTLFTLLLMGVTSTITATASAQRGVAWLSADNAQTIVLNLTALALVVFAMFAASAALLGGTPGQSMAGLAAVREATGSTQLLRWAAVMTLPTIAAYAIGVEAVPALLEHLDLATVGWRHENGGGSGLSRLWAASSLAAGIGLTWLARSIGILMAKNGRLSIGEKLSGLSAYENQARTRAPRVMSAVIDAAAIAAIFQVSWDLATLTLVLTVGSQGLSEMPRGTTDLAALLIAPLAAIVMFQISIYKGGGTPGQLAAGLRVRNTNGARTGSGRAGWAAIFTVLGPLITASILLGVSALWAGNTLVSPLAALSPMVFYGTTEASTVLAGISLIAAAAVLARLSGAVTWRSGAWVGEWVTGTRVHTEGQGRPGKARAARGGLAAAGLALLLAAAVPLAVIPYRQSADEQRQAQAEEDWKAREATRKAEEAAELAALPPLTAAQQQTLSNFTAAISKVDAALQRKSHQLTYEATGTRPPARGGQGPWTVTSYPNGNLSRSTNGTPSEACEFLQCYTLSNGTWKEDNTVYIADVSDYAATMTLASLLDLDVLHIPGAVDELEKSIRSGLDITQNADTYTLTQQIRTPAGKAAGTEQTTAAFTADSLTVTKTVSVPESENVNYTETYTLTPLGPGSASAISPPLP